jgi:glycerol-3-phosphate dehydrogenase
VAINYVTATELLRDEQGRVVGVRLLDTSDLTEPALKMRPPDRQDLPWPGRQDRLTAAKRGLGRETFRQAFGLEGLSTKAQGRLSPNLRDGQARKTGRSTEARTADVYAKVIINATGAWADFLRGQARDNRASVGSEARSGPAMRRPGRFRRFSRFRQFRRKSRVAGRIRPLRGSHLIFPAWRLPVAQAISFLHPVDRRPVFIFPWEGITLVGTTDVDHDIPLDQEPRISPAEVAYLMAAVESQFPSLNLTLDDVIATFAGVRPVIGSGKADPSKEARDHVVWQENGLLTVTGGKLTTFRRIALDALRAARDLFPTLPKPDAKTPVLDRVDITLKGAEHLAETQRRRLLGRYGANAPALVLAAKPGELEPIPGTQILWAELRWAARAEGVVHLDDLLLRRVRLGLLLPEGGAAVLGRVRAVCQAELGWDDGRWETEQAAYLALWRCCYSLPDRAAVPDWRAMLTEAKGRRQIGRRLRRRRWFRRSAWVGGVGSAVVAAGTWLWRRRRRRT